MSKIINFDRTGVIEVVEDIVKNSDELKKKRAFIVVWMDEDDGSKVSFQSGGIMSDILWCVDCLYTKIHKDFFDVG